MSLPGAFDNSCQALRSAKSIAKRCGQSSMRPCAQSFRDREPVGRKTSATCISQKKALRGLCLAKRKR
eukprot:15171763-Alexandrium_andersonii.AAC.1